MDVKTLTITKVKVDKIDDCKFALFIFDNKNCSYWLKGGIVQTLSHSICGFNPRYLVSKDKRSLSSIKDSVKWRINDIGGHLRKTWNEIFDETFNQN